MKPWYVYLLRCADDSLYCGVTIDLPRRLDEHNSSDKGAKYTRGRRPVSLAWFMKQPTRSAACKLEYRIKRLHKPDKELLVTGKLNLTR